MRVSELNCPSSRPNPHRCPWWLGWALLLPLRRWFEEPSELLGPWISRGDRVLEIGPGMGFFTPFLAECVGELGHVHCVDVEDKMLKTLRRRLRRRGLDGRVDLRLCSSSSFGISDLDRRINVAVLIHVLHEIPDPIRALNELFMALAPGGKLLLVEPKGHVSAQTFDSEVALAREVGFTQRAASRPGHEGKGLWIVLERPIA